MSWCSFFLYVLLLLVSSAISLLAQANDHQQFLQCLTTTPSISQVVSAGYADDDVLNNSTSNISHHHIYTPLHPSYQSVLNAYVQNLRVPSHLTPGPIAIVTPVHESHVQTAIYCAKSHGLRVRIRSGGHDFEGLSYLSQLPFVLIDLFNLRSIHVDTDSRTAWVQSGATLGETYYAISRKSRTLAFPAGFWSTVGVGGHISGGGYGPMIRKYGLAADNVIDVKMVDAQGRILDRDTMGEDLFWAIRGGGGGNFGVILAWKLKLVEVPELVTICLAPRSSEQNATNLVHRWQHVAPKMPKDLTLELLLKSFNSSSSQGGNKRTMVATFLPIFQGRLEDELLPLMNERFPELGLVKEECSEMSWIEAVVQLSFFPRGTPAEILLDRRAPHRTCTKYKSDYAQEPMSEEALEGLWDHFHKMDPGMGEMIWTAYGGRMAEISETETPYPHRGALFMIYQAVHWDGEREGTKSPRHLSWIRDLYEYMTPHVSNNPRSSYINYRDLDLGRNNVVGEISYEDARIWGRRYYKGNFERLAKVKGAVDPDNFFRDEQSIPPLY